MIDLVIDRTETDVLLGNSKGIYQAEDLNRVGQAVEELAALLPQLDLQAAVAPKPTGRRQRHMTQTNGYAQQIWPCIWRT